MTKNDVTADRIRAVLWDGLCMDCSDDLAGMSPGNCSGCLVLVALDSVVWLDTKRRETAGSRV
jgi:hypothetical protein